jgi:catechol 2,3-dioxygenase-like lactoylglutathione lyase family enzyme
MALIEAGPLHRVALAVDDAATAYEWFERVLGAVRRGPRVDAGAGAGASALPRDQHGRVLTIDDADLAGTDNRSLSLGGVPFVLLSKGVPGGPMARFLGRYGPAVHSLAWEVDDLWSAQNLLVERGLRLGAINVGGRHFYLHPRDSHGILIEWTDVSAGHAGPRDRPGPAAVEVEGLAWVTAAVADAEAAAAFLVDVAGARPVQTGSRGPAERELTVEVWVGNVQVRLVTPRAAASPYARFLDTGPRLCAVALRVGDLDGAVGALEAAGVPTVRRDANLAATDPAATFGIPIEWTA